MLNRRKLLGGIAGGAGIAGLASPSLAKGTRELSMVTSWPKNFPGQGTSAERIADCINRMTNGRITIKIYGAGELVPAFEVFDAVSSGKADMYHSADYYFQGKSPVYNFFSTVPFGLISNELDAWIYHGGGQELWDEVSAGFGIKPHLCGNNGVQMGGWFNKEISSPEDFKGLKFRMPGVGGEVLRRLGANTLTMPAGEVYTSLQSGAIDAAEWVGPWNDLSLGFYKVAKYYYWPGFHEPASTLCLGTNKALWDGLDEFDQNAIATACRVENTAVPAEFYFNNMKALETLVNDHGVELREMPADVFNAFGEQTEIVLKELAEKDAITRNVYESYISFRNDVSRWTHVSNGAYISNRQLFLEKLLKL